MLSTFITFCLWTTPRYLAGQIQIIFEICIVCFSALKRFCNVAKSELVLICNVTNVEGGIANFGLFWVAGFFFAYEIPVFPWEPRLRPNLFGILLRR